MELFDEMEQKKPVSGMYIGGTDGNGALDAIPGLDGLFELSVEAYYAAVHAQMSELPIKAEICRFVEKVLKAGSRAANGGSVSGGKSAGASAANAGKGEETGGPFPAARRTAAARAAFDRGDPDTAAVLKAAWKVRVEIHRITGFLRFSADSRGVYTARCAPDHCVLPALAEHFTLRFGEIPWAIIDEKRGICLCRGNNGDPRLIPLGEAAGVLNGAPSTDACGARSSAAAPEAAGGNSLSGAFPSAPPVPAVKPDGEKAANTAREKHGDYWEDLWRLYHRSINNESRNNPRLQRQFMPERYHKYLTELT